MIEHYKFSPHGPWVPVGGKKFCFSCGIIALNNPASQWCVDKGCLYDLHSNYQRTMKKLTRGDRNECRGA